jgi:hypothetical protein
MWLCSGRRKKGNMKCNRTVSFSEQTKAGALPCLGLIIRRNSNKLKKNQNNISPSKILCGCVLEEKKGNMKSNRTVSFSEQTKADALPSWINYKEEE